MEATYMNVHCSACGTPLASGGSLCSGCGLQLTARAVPTPAPQRKPISLLAIAVACVGILWIVAYASNAHQEAQHAAALAAMPKFQPAVLMNDIHSGKTNPLEFQKLCGTPALLYNRKDFFSLFYTDKNLVVMFRHRTPGTTKAEAARKYPYALYDEVYFWQIDPRHIVSPDSALDALQCKAAQ
jgi:hypothetical protein